MTDLTLYRAGRQLSVTETTATAIRAWLLEKQWTDLPRMRRAVSPSHWDDVRAGGDYLEVQLEKALLPEPWTGTRTALLPLPPHEWAGWLLLEDFSGATRSPIVIGSPPEGLLPAG